MRAGIGQVLCTCGGSEGCEDEDEDESEYNKGRGWAGTRGHSGGCEGGGRRRGRMRVGHITVAMAGAVGGKWGEMSDLMKK